MRNRITRMVVTLLIGLLLLAGPSLPAVLSAIDAATPCSHCSCGGRGCCVDQSVPQPAPAPAAPSASAGFDRSDFLPLFSVLTVLPGMGDSAEAFHAPAVSPRNLPIPLFRRDCALLL
jgi:hypothetical protein